MARLKDKAITLLGSASLGMQTGQGGTIFTTDVGKVTRVVMAVVRDATASLAGGTSYTITGLRATFSLAALTTAGTGMIVVTGTLPADATLQQQLEVAASTVISLTCTTGSTAASTATIDVFGFTT